MKELAAQFPIHHTAVAQHLRRAGISPRTRGLDNQQIDQAVHWYRQGWSLAKIDARHDVDANTIRTALLNRGIRMRDTRGRDR